jgi:hypothetical protein
MHRRAGAKVELEHAAHGDLVIAERAIMGNHERTHDGRSVLIDPRLLALVLHASPLGIWPTFRGGATADQHPSAHGEQSAVHFREHRVIVASNGAWSPRPRRFATTMGFAKDSMSR